MPINPDLDAAPVGRYEITHHPTNRAGALIHAPNGRLISAMTKAKLHKLKNLYQPTNDNTPFPQVVAELTLYHKAIAYDTIPGKENILYKRKKQHNQPGPNGTWSIITDNLYDTLHHCFDIKRVIHCNPVNLPLRAKEYISHDP